MSVNALKQRKIIFAAKHYLMHYEKKHATLPPCRFDVVGIEHIENKGSDSSSGKGSQLSRVEWIRAAFDAPSF
jgi:putative endonuclease